MPNFSDIKQKVRRIFCCVPSDVDQNEGPPPARTSEQGVTQDRQTAVDMGTDPITEEEEEQEQPEEDWGDEEPEDSTYDDHLFVVEADKYGTYNYDKSTYTGINEVQLAYDNLVQSYRPQSKTEDEDPSLVWHNSSYERPVREWSSGPEMNISARAQEAR